MVNQLHLSGNDLIVYALIYGFSQDGVSEFCGSCNYIGEWLNMDRRAVLRILQRLTKNKFIIKHDIEISPKFKMPHYLVNQNMITGCDKLSQVGVTKRHRGCDKLSQGCDKKTHNINNNKNINNDNDISKNKKFNQGLTRNDFNEEEYEKNILGN